MADHRRTIGQQWLTVGQQWATWRATPACRSHVILRGTATSTDWVSHAYVAATSAAGVAKGILTLLQSRTLDLVVKETMHT
ncbi:hypothetical protein Tco_1110410 [Tanacetum coccineum]|uniref:Uncharacterized protein n=1 Tax=Tanacetum coccineum TaxID=301880 RepID=A0ABQ5IIS7_9ASTR